MECGFMVQSCYTDLETTSRNTDVHMNVEFLKYSDLINEDENEFDEDKLSSLLKNIICDYLFSEEDSYDQKFIDEESSIHIDNDNNCVTFVYNDQFVYVGITVSYMNNLYNVFDEK